MVGALISVTCIVFTVIADTILKPLKYSKSVQKVAEVVKDKFGSGVRKIASFVGGIAGKLENIPLVGKYLGKVSEALTNFENYIKETFDKITIKVIKKEYSQKFLEWLNKGSKNNAVYFGKNGDEEVYVGITKQDVEKRLKQHIANGKPFTGSVVKHSNLTRNQARAIEQYYIKKGPNKFNIINSISSNSEFYGDAYDWALQYLGKG